MLTGILTALGILVAWTLVAFVVGSRVGAIIRHPEDEERP